MRWKQWRQEKVPWEASNGQHRHTVTMASQQLRGRARQGLKIFTVFMSDLALFPWGDNMDWGEWQMPELSVSRSLWKVRKWTKHRQSYRIKLKTLTPTKTQNPCNNLQTQKICPLLPAYNSSLSHSSHTDFLLLWRHQFPPQGFCICCSFNQEPYSST